VDPDAPEPSADPPALERQDGADEDVPAAPSALALFVSPTEHRPRALFRLLLHFVGLAIVVVGLQLASAVVPGWLVVVLDLVLVVVVTWVAARFLDQRPFVDLGLRVDGPRALDLLAGIVVGAIAIGVVAALEVALGLSHFERVPLDAARLSAAGVATWFFVAVAIQEELVFRGYHIVNLAEGLTGARLTRSRAALVAVTLSSSVFGFAHVMNANATALSTFNIAVGGGCLLSAGFLLTGDLAFSIGLHLAWNLGQCFLGMPVSGFVMSRAALLSREVAGDAWITGGAFGPEAGAVGLAGMSVGALLAVAYGRARYGQLAVRLRLKG
jgi:membrane protease YdiL (CAAX protease family)